MAAKKQEFPSDLFDAPVKIAVRSCLKKPVFLRVPGLGQTFDSTTLTSAKTIIKITPPLH